MSRRRRASDLADSGSGLRSFKLECSEFESDHEWVGVSVAEDVAEDHPRMPPLQPHDTQSIAGGWTSDDDSNDPAGPNLER